MDVRGKGIVITGASRGLGAALMRELAQRGARVAGVARGGDALEEVVRGLRAAGADAHAIVGDLARKEDIHRISGAAAALLGEIDVLIHNGSALGRRPCRSSSTPPARIWRRCSPPTFSGRSASARR
jgi:NAD(P)-dependent dehydrogenase (short-subunit alcohol dehydrogenase family)